MSSLKIVRTKETFRERISNQKTGSKEGYWIAIDNFEFSAVIEKFDTFVAKCNNYEGTSVTLVQYLGVIPLDGKDYFATWHTPAFSDVDVTCSYPEIIKYILKHNFGGM